MEFPSETDVLIVGGGPVGMALACELRRSGIDALTIDRAAGIADTSRAAVVQARTLEMLEPLEVTARLVERGLISRTFRVRDRDAILATLDFSGIPSAYNYALMCPQNVTETILLERLRELGGDVRRPVEATSFAIDDRGATVTLSFDGAEQRVRTTWLVGCDGSHSAVREAAGIPFEGGAYALSFVLADLEMEWPLGRDEFAVFFSPQGILIVVPLPGDRWRVIADVDGAPEHPPLELFQRLLDERGPERERARIVDTKWTSRFRVDHRITETPRKGRAIVCGDAAHVHSPAGGQGMNTGIQDAISLANVLAAVARGGDEAALDAWARERHDVAKGVIEFTDRLTRVATLRSPAARGVRDVAMVLAGHLPFVTSAIARRIAELPRDATS